MHPKHPPDLSFDRQGAAQLDEISAFVSTARAGSFSVAARRLARDASTISRRIAALERRLGVRLIERTTRQLALTEAGRVYLARMGAVLDDIADANAAIVSAADHPQGLLRVALPRAYGRMRVSPMLPRFMQRFPQVRLDVRFSDHLTDLVGEGFDVAVRLGALKESGLVARKVGDVQRRLFAAPGYLKRCGTPTTPHDLPGHRCLGFTGYERGSEWVLRSGKAKVTLNMSLALCSDDAEALIAASIAGAGIVLATDWLVAGHAEGRKLRPVLPDWDVGERSAIYVVTSSARFLPAKTRVFIDMLMEELRGAERPS